MPIRRHKNGVLGDIMTFYQLQFQQSRRVSDKARWRSTRAKGRALPPATWLSVCQSSWKLNSESWSCKLLGHLEAVHHHPDQDHTDSQMARYGLRSQWGVRHDQETYQSVIV